MSQGKVSSLRAGFREEAGLARPFHCLETCTGLLRSNDPQAAATVMGTLQHHLGAAEIVWLRYQAGVLEAVAASGSLVSAGTRYPMRAGLQPFLSWPCKALVRPRPASNWLVHTPNPGFEWLVPLAFAGQVTGLLGIAGHADQGVPAKADQQLLEMLSVLLAACGGAAPSVRRPDALASEDLSRLTPREREIMSLLPRGYSNARIAESLGIAPGTVKTHVERILGKLQFDDRAQAAARAVELGIGHSGVEG
ncbi:MAG: LuxR C-terminal-related transcriptional regulator [Alcanivorax sp.]|nr:LuxR C-terminal-related transcriptional regulator [Alcanivorax sp.]